MPRQKIENYRKAVSRLAEAVEEYAQTPASTVVRDGVIQRFEFTFELAWKSLREFMADQGVRGEELSFPKNVLKRAYGEGLIDDDQTWLAMLEARNLTSHVYSDDQAAQVVADISQRYLHSLQALAEWYSKR